MEVIFEPDYQGKILHMSFAAGSQISSAKDVLAWRSQWLGALKSWHSPYKAFVNCENLQICGPAEELKKPFDTMMAFFNGFFLKKIVGYGFRAELGHGQLPFEVLAGEQEAAEALGIRSRANKGGEDFRGSLHFDSHFQQHVIELQASTAVVFDSKEKIAVLKSKLTNTLMQWHSAWSLLIDCSKIQFTPEVAEEFQKLERLFKGFFLKKIIGYSPSGDKESYPFPVYRARHRAAAELEGEGNFSGEKADCASRKT